MLSWLFTGNSSGSSNSGGNGGGETKPFDDGCNPQPNPCVADKWIKRQNVVRRVAKCTIHKIVDDCPPDPCPTDVVKNLNRRKRETPKFEMNQNFSTLLNDGDAILTPITEIEEKIQEENQKGMDETIELLEKAYRQEGENQTKSPSSSMDVTTRQESTSIAETGNEFVVEDALPSSTTDVPTAASVSSRKETSDGSTGKIPSANRRRK